MGEFCKKLLIVLVPLCSIIAATAQQTTVAHSRQTTAATGNDSLLANYTVTALGGLSGTQFAQANAINDSGQIAGKSANHAFLWENGTMKDLGTLGGGISSANAINDLGQVVGESETSNGEIHAFLWERGFMRDLGNPGETSSAHGINNKAVIVGAIFAKNVRGGAVVWKDGSRQSLGDLGPSGSGSTAIAINNGGEIVGVSSGLALNGSGVIRAVIWQSGAIRDIGTLGGLNSTANGLNNHGDVVGWAELGDQTTAAFIWRDGAMHQLGMFSNGLLAPGNGIQATAANDRGQIVGSSLNSKGESRAVLWENGEITDLNDSLDATNGVLLTRATAINNHAQIVVEQQAGDGSPKSFLLTP